MDTLAVLQHLHDARDAVGDPSKMVGSIANRAQRILDSIAAARDLIEKDYQPEHARAEWESTGNQARDIKEMRGHFHPAYREGFRARFDEAEQARAEAERLHADAAPPELSDEQADRLHAMAEQTGDEPAIEVLPLPGDRFMLVFSGWPDPMPKDIGMQLRDQCGAAAVLTAPHPVYLPDGYRATWGEGK